MIAACRPSCVPPPPLSLRPLRLQWQQYERKVAGRSSEQHSVLPGAAGRLDGMRRRLDTPAASAAGGGPLATPQAGVRGAPAVLALSSHLASTMNLAATDDTPRSGSSLKENLGADLNRNPLVGERHPAAPLSSFAAAAAAALSGGGDMGAAAGDSMLQQASSLFLQQVEDMRRKYTAQVEQLREEVEGLAAQRDTLASEAASAGASAKALKVQIAAGQRELDALTADLQRAQSRLASLESAQRAEQDRYQKERAAAAAAAEREAAAQQARLAGERDAAAAAAKESEQALARQAAALEARAARMEEQGRALVDRDAELAQREREFEAQVLCCLPLPCGQPAGLLFFTGPARPSRPHGPPCYCLGWQVKDITQSLKGREARVREAEDVAAAHLQRERRLIEMEGELLKREQVLEHAAVEAAAAKKELEAQRAGAAREAARVRDAGVAAAEQQAAAAAQLEAREVALQEREEELAAAVHSFESERDQAAEADAEQRRHMLDELRQLEAGVEAAMGQLREAEEEAAAVRRRVLEAQGEAAEAETARDRALLAHKAAQQVGAQCMLLGGPRQE